MIHHAWLQKHPSPAAQGGEFHWYPDDGDRELRASFVERVRGLEPPAVLWHLEPGRAAWGQVFSATAPTDGRRYVGLVLSVVEGDAPLADLLAQLSPPAAEPWSDGVPIEQPPAAPSLPPSREVRAQRRDPAAIARALLTGGAAPVDDIGGDDLPQRIASIERIMPELAGVRTGVWTLGPPATASDRVAELAAAAWREPTSRAARAWRLACELAVDATVDDIARRIEPLDVRRVLAASERNELRDGATVVDALQAWSRGRFDRSPDAATLPARLAELVALRVLARLAADQDEALAIAEARWYALLSSARRKALLGAVAQRTRSLRALVEATHA